jgi:MATE family multidrug resistance protein
MNKRFLDPETFIGWGPFISQAIGTTMLQCFEWWAFEVLAIFAGWMEVTELSAQVAVINIVALCYMIPMGVQFAVSAKIGFSIGENRIK